MESLMQPDEWRHRLGYLPVPLFGPTDAQRYVLLNGSKGNFCLDVSEDLEAASHANIAWSTDVDHYVRITSDKVHVTRWDIPERREEYAIAQVSGNLNLFQRYLESRPAPREKSVVAHAIAAYRVIRAKVRQGSSGHQGLLAFLAALTRAWQQQKNIDGLLPLWSDRSEADDVLRDILSSDEIALVIERILDSSFSKSGGPDLDLLIRHASGRIFQEAHYLALMPVQGDLFLGAQATPTAGGAKGIGAFFTPTPLVRTVVEQALARFAISNRRSITIFDPACGSGEFLREALRQLSITGFRGDIKVVGFDISPSACAMARFVLAAEGRSWGNQVQVLIECKDALAANDWPTADVCLMNPPFISWLGLTKDQQDIVAACLGGLHQQRPDMASAFLYRALTQLAENGVLGTVLPASLLDGTSAERLRTHITENAKLDVVVRLGSQQVFSDAIVDPALVIVTRPSEEKVKQPDPVTLMLWADHEPASSETALRALRRITGDSDHVRTLIEDDHFSIYGVSSDRLSDDWAPRPYRSAKLLLELSSARKVSDYFSVQQGAITGMNAAFLLSQDDFSSLPKGEQKFFRPAILNESIRSGQIQTNWWVFYPYGEGVPDISDEETLAARLKNYYSRWLLPNKQSLIRRARIKEDKWWRLSEYRAWQSQPSVKIVSTYFGAAGSFALDRVGKHVVVQGYGWVPKSKAFSEKDQTLLAILAVLNSPMTNKLLAGVSNNLAGGQWNLSKRFIEKMPLVDVEALPNELLDALAFFGSAMSDGRIYDVEKLDRHVAEAFRIQGHF